MPDSNTSDEIRILGVRFLRGTAAGAVARTLKGGFVVAPSGPGLAELKEHPAYREALSGADYALTDSAFMVLVWRLLKRERVLRVSGLEYLVELLRQPALREPGAVFWAMPSAAAMERNIAWLRENGHPVTPDDCYVAPQYPAGEIADPVLLKILERKRPAHVIVAVGGGVQERLGFYLKRNLSWRPRIHCIGAAIGFLTGDQVNIPMWADHFFLGWLLRCLSKPSTFIPRYWRARKLFGLMWKYGSESPQDPDGNR